MEDVVRARQAARGVVADIEPAELRDLIDRRLQEATMTPAVLTLASARAADGEADPDAIDRRAAGVQLIYDGLQLTRRLAREPPWEDEPEPVAADLDILAADVAVARGFSVLARTEAAGKAVETVQAFGHDETERAAGRPHPELGGRSLEGDVFELAIRAGVTATGADPPVGVRRFAVRLARSIDRDRPSAPELLSEPATEALAGLVAGGEATAAAPERLWATSVDP